jgi:putative ABC transport system permease protein
MMTDWRNHLRANLAPLAADPAREEEIIEELAEHLAERERAALSAGATAAEARKAAWEELPDPKGLSRTIQNLDQSRPTPPPPPLAARTSAIRGMAQDVRYTLRLLRRRPGFVVAVVLTLALGIGATTAAFSLVYGVLLKPLPYPDAEQLVGVFRVKLQTLQRRSTAAALADYYSVPPVVFRDFEGSLPSLSALGAYTTNDASVRIGNRTERVASALVTSGVFRALAVPPQIGGPLTRADDRTGAPARVVLSDSFWRTRFGADPGVIGHPLTIDGVSHTITGIMPRGFAFPDGGEALWMTLDEQSRTYPARDSGFL